MDFTPVDNLASNSDNTMDKIEVSSVTEDLETELEVKPVNPGPKEKETEVKEGPKLSEEGPKEQEEVAAAVVKPPVVKKATVKQKSKTAAKIIKKMGDKGKYDSRNQQKVVIMVALLGADLSTYTKDAPVIEDAVGFDFGTVIPDGELPSNNLAMYLMDIGSSLMMNEMIDSQWKD